MKEALYWEKDGDRVHCLLCPQNCRIGDGQVGACAVRQNIDGTLYTLNYGRCSSIALDPIEKKPLYHFYPGTEILSLGTVGCNLSCPFCQNWGIAQGVPDEVHTVYQSPQEAAALALESKKEQGNIGIAYTYSEPLMWYEYVLKTAELVKEQGMVNVLVTNGTIQEEPLKRLLPAIDALNIDVKGFTDSFYKKVCFGSLSAVKRTVERAAEQAHVEITTLIIPTLNDSEAEIEELAKWIAGISQDIPLHFSRYFPAHKLEIKPTPLEILKRAREIASHHLNFVYLGNVPGEEGRDTHCPECGALLISRGLFGASVVGLKEGTCTNCGYKTSVIHT